MRLHARSRLEMLNDRPKLPAPRQDIPDGWEREAQRKSLSGGQGSITKVRRMADGTLGALKRLLPQHEKTTERRFRIQREVTSLDALGGSGTPLLLENNAEHWKDKEVDLYFIEEWVEGPTLTDHIGGTKLSIEDAVFLTLGMLETLKKCHNLDIFHRDLKPDNVILKGGNIACPIIVDFGQAFIPPPDRGPAEFETKAGQQLGNRFLSLPEFVGGRGSPTTTSDLTYLVGILFFAITGRAPRQLRDEKGRMPHLALADAIPTTIVNDDRWKILSSVFDVGFQWLMEWRFQSAEQLEQYLNMLTGPRDNQGAARLMVSLDRLKQARASDEVRLPKVAKKHIHNASRKLYDLLRGIAKDPGFGFDNNSFAIGEQDGFPSSGMSLGIYMSGETGLGAHGHHSISVRNDHFVAAYQIDGGGGREYFEGSIFAPGLFEDAVAEIAPEILSALVEEYTERMKQRYKR